MAALRVESARGRAETVRVKGKRGEREREGGVRQSMKRAGHTTVSVWRGVHGGSGRLKVVPRRRRRAPPGGGRTRRKARPARREGLGVRSGGGAGTHVGAGARRRASAPSAGVRKVGHVSFLNFFPVVKKIKKTPDSRFFLPGRGPRFSAALNSAAKKATFSICAK